LKLHFFYTYTFVAFGDVAPIVLTRQIYTKISLSQSSSIFYTKPRRNSWGGKYLYSYTIIKMFDHEPETEFLDVIGTNVLRVFLFAIHSHICKQIYSPPPPGAKVV
jgi:hypothetical protein